jgi:sigma-B regulation protein RsbU (phosphoserine phosphatase)
MDAQATETAAIADLLALAHRAAPGASFAVLDPNGSVVAGQSGIGDEPTRSIALSCAGSVVGTLEIRGHAPEGVVELLARAIELTLDTERSRRMARIEQELAIGRRIQVSLMPRTFPALPGWEFGSAYEAAREVGGDFYDAFRLRYRPQEFGLAMADVTGKGVAPALLMADTRALIHAAADHTDDPATCLSAVNRILVEERRTALFVTAFHAVVDGPSGETRYASAGHDPQFVLRSDGSLTVLDATGILLGISADFDIETKAVTLEPGDALVLYTDGVTEARDTKGGFYGEERFLRLLTTCGDRTAPEIVATILDDVRAFRDEAEPFDDIALLVVRRQPAMEMEIEVAA